jgi:hypothetical protein
MIGSLLCRKLHIKKKNPKFEQKKKEKPCVGELSLVLANLKINKRTFVLEMRI